MPSRTVRAIRSLSRQFRTHQSAHHQSAHHQSAHHQYQPSYPAPRMPAPPTQSSISCLRATDFLSSSRIATEQFPEAVLAWRRIASWRAAAAQQTALEAIGDTLVFFRTSVHDAYITRLARILRRRRGALLSRFSGTRMLSASAGMGLAAIAAREERPSGPESLLRMLSSTEGPHRIGVGLLPPILRSLLAALFAWLSIGSVVYSVLLYPHVLPWLLLAASVCFSTRPNLDSFMAWTKRCAPLVAKQKTMLLDKIRAQVAPYMMGLRPPVLADFGLFSVVTLMDHADYVYVYAGFLSRWCLLGWYNASDDYNFDKIRSVNHTLITS